jgi:hypothetical protein
MSSEVPGRRRVQVPQPTARVPVPPVPSGAVARLGGSAPRWDGGIRRGKGTRLSEVSGPPADDPWGGRHPTSHERMTGLPWDASYEDGPAPWDVGEPQPAVVRVASEGGFAGAVLDAGCGTGDNALLVASLGAPLGAPAWFVTVRRA